MPAGVSDGTIEDSAITATSFLDSSSKPSAGRLNSSNGAWCAKVNDKHQYLQIDLGMSLLKYIYIFFCQISNDQFGVYHIRKKDTERNYFT